MERLGGAARVCRLRCDGGGLKLIKKKPPPRAEQAGATAATIRQVEAMESGRGDYVDGTSSGVGFFGGWASGLPY